MGEIKGNDVFDQSAISAPLEFSANVDKAIKSIDTLISTMKKGEKSIGLAKTTKAVRVENEKLSQSEVELAKIAKQVETAKARQSKEYIKQQKELVALRKTQKDLVNEEGRELGTIEKLTKRNKELTEQRKKLNLETSKGQKSLRRINSELDKNNKALKNSSDQLTKQKIGIGDYQQALSGLPGPLGGAVRATNALTSASLRFIATPIGAVIAAIGLALAALTTFFKGSEEGQNSFTKVTNAALVVWGNFKDIIIDVGKGIFKLTNLDFKGAKEAFNDAADGVKNFVDESKKEIATQNRLSDLRAKTTKLERELIVITAKARRDANLLREESAELEETNAARSVQLIRQAIKIEDELAQKREEVAANNLEILRGEAALSSSTIEVKKEVAQAEADLINIQAERAKRTKTLLKELNTLEKKAAKQSNDIAKNQADKNIELVKGSLTEIQALKPKQEDNLDLYVPSTEALKKRLDANLEEYKKNQEKLAEIDSEAKEVRDEIVAGGIELSKEIFTQFTQLRIQQISDELTAVEFARNREIEAAGESESAKFEINRKYDEERKKLQRKQVQAERAAAVFNVLISTAQAIAAANSLGPPASIPAIIFAAAIGAAQLAAVIAAPIPKFDKGTDSTPSEYEAAEKSPEFRRDAKTGKWSLLKKPTIFRNNPGDTIIGSKETDSLLGTIHDITGENILNDHRNILGLLNNDLNGDKKESELAYILKSNNRDLINTIKNKKETSISVSGGSVKTTERSGSRTVIREDHYYKR